MAFRHPHAGAHSIAPNTLKKVSTGNGRCGKIAMQTAACQFLADHGKVPASLPTYDESDALCVLRHAIDGQ